MLKTLHYYLVQIPIAQHETGILLYSMEELIKLYDYNKSVNTGAILVYYKDKILPVFMSDIAFFFVRDGIVCLTTFEETTYTLNKTLDELEKMAGTAFFRINRQHIINRRAVVNAASHSQRKMSVLLTVPTEDRLLISKEKVPQFLNWLTMA